MIGRRLQSSRLKQLPSILYQRSQTQALQRLRFVHVNALLLQQWDMSVDAFQSVENLALFGGETEQDAISTIYAGHQFGIYTTRLGDGRVHILGDFEQDQQCWEIQLKGAGPTPYARGNNGRMSSPEAAGEYLTCEAMTALGIASTRALCWVEGSCTKSGKSWSVLARSAPTHLRFGHFEYLHNQGEWSALQALADHVISHYYPNLEDYSGAQRYLQFLYAVTGRTARLIAQWQAVGFVHSVLNSDNMSIIGLTLDYGVCGFMENYDPAFCPNDADEQQRYAFDQQPEVGLWNCLALAEALSELLPAKQIPANLLVFYRRIYGQNYLTLMRSKLGLQQPREIDARLIEDLLAILQRQQLDFSDFFHALSCRDLETFSYLGKDWLKRYRQRLQLEASTEEDRSRIMQTHNPAHILRRGDLQQSIMDWQQHGDATTFKTLLVRLQTPFSQRNEKR